MMKLLIRAHDLGVKGEADILDRLNELGLDGVQLVAYKSLDDVSYNPGSITKERAEKVSETLSDKMIPLLGAYFNPVHPNEEKVQKGIQIFKEYLSLVSTFNAVAVGSETGSYQGEPWTYHPMNSSDEALDRVVEVFGELAKHAKKEGVYLAIEPAAQHVCSTVERLDEALKRINSDHVKVIVDLYNLLEASNEDRIYEILKTALNLFNERILLFHIKDYKKVDGKIVQCGVGQGLFDYDLILDLIHEHNPDALLVLEGTVKEDLKPAVDFIYRKLGKYGC